MYIYIYIYIYIQLYVYMYNLYLYIRYIYISLWCLWSRVSCFTDLLDAVWWMYKAWNPGSQTQQYIYICVCVCVFKSSIIDIEHYLIIVQYLVLINSPSEQEWIINVYNICIYIYIYMSENSKISKPHTKRGAMENIFIVAQITTSHETSFITCGIVLPQ